MRSRKTIAVKALGLLLLPGCMSVYLGEVPTPTMTPTLEPLTPTASPLPPSFPPETGTPGPEPTPSPTPTGTPLPITDEDQDGWPFLLDCNDTQASVHPGAEDLCGDGLDSDCTDGDPVCPCLPEETLIGRLELSGMPGNPGQPLTPLDNPPYGYDSDIPLVIDASLDSICDQTVTLSSLDGCYVRLFVFPDPRALSPEPIRVDPEVCPDMPGTWDVRTGASLDYRFTWDWRSLSGDIVEDESVYVIRAEWPNGQALETQVYLRD